MELVEALDIILKLAEKNISKAPDERLEQEEACSVVSNLLDIVLHDQEKAKECGEYLISTCKLPKNNEGRVQLQGGDKTPVGMTKTIFNVFSNIARDV